jgi:hypothetical protein
MFRSEYQVPVTGMQLITGLVGARPQHGARHLCRFTVENTSDPGSSDAWRFELEAA